MKHFSFICLILISLNLKSQHNYVQAFQGNWMGIITNDPNSNITIWKVIKGNKVLTFDFDSNKLRSVEIETLGFLNEQKKLVNNKELQNYGKYLYFCDKSNECFSIDTFDPHEPSFFYYGSSVFEFSKIDSFPNYVYNELMLWDIKYNTTHSHEFWELSIGMIKSQKSFIYKSPNIKSKQYLIQNDLVQIISEKGDWIEIIYYGKLKIRGWIKRDSVEKFKN